MSTDRVRQVERSYMSFVLKQNPNFYEQANPVNQTAYEFSNGRRFTGRRPYSNYFPMEFHVIDEGIAVYDEGVPVMETLTEAEYLAEIAV
jgi:hypothetical protein